MEFTKTTCAVSKGNTVQGIGQRQGNIYYLMGLQDIALAGVERTVKATSQEICHQRIGNRSFSQQGTEMIKMSVMGPTIITVRESTMITTIHCSDVGYCLFRTPLATYIPYHVFVPSLLLLLPIG